MDRSTHRAGRLSLRMTPSFLDKCKEKAEERGLTLTEFVQLAMVAELARSWTTYSDAELNDQDGHHG